MRGLDSATALAGAGVLLATPGALLAAWDLADRIRKRARATALSQAAARLRIEHGDGINRVTLDGVELADLTPDQILARTRSAEAAFPACPKRPWRSWRLGGEKRNRRSPVRRRHLHQHLVAPVEPQRER